MRAPSDRRPRSERVLARLATLDPAARNAVREALTTCRTRGHDVVARQLAALGITHLYVAAGLPIDETTGACARAGLTVTGVRHQQASVMMAAAHNYMAGRLAAVAMVSAGAAVTNAMTGVLAAQDNGWPALLLAGAVEDAAAGMGAFTGLDSLRVMQPLAKACLRAAAVTDIAPALQRAAHTAVAGRPGVVCVELPEDSLAGFDMAPNGDPATSPQLDDAPLPPDTAALEQAAALLRAAQTPLLVYGKGVRWDDAHHALRAFVDHLQLPFVASPIGRGLLPDDHTLSRTAVQGAALAAADCVLVVGARLNWTFRHGAEIRPGTPIVHIDCCDKAFAEGPPRAVTLHGRASRLLPALLDTLQRHPRPSRDRAPPPPDMQHPRPSAAGTTSLPTANDVAAVIAQALPANAITVLDGNIALLAAQRHIVARQPLSRLTPGTSGCMGTGLPHAIAAARAGGGRPVVLVTGDMALSLNFFELETAVRHDIPLTVVVLNNDGPSGERRQRAAFPPGSAPRALAYRPGIRYDRMARQLGVRIERADDAAALPQALARALQAKRPALIQIRVDPVAG